MRVYAEFCVEGKPVGKGRPRWGRRNGRMYTPADTRRYEEAVAWACKTAMAGRIPKTGPVGVFVRAYKKIPAHVGKNGRERMLDGKIRPMTRPDLDNVVKAILDGCNGIAFEDDAQIAVLHAAAYYSDVPRVEVEFWEET